MVNYVTHNPLVFLSVIKIKKILKKNPMVLFYVKMML